VTTTASAPRIVDRSQWLTEREALLAAEKQLTRQRDELAAARRALPWLRVTEPYTFETTDGTKTLDALFEGRRQLIVYHFMFGPGWTEGCPSCSFWTDSFNGTDVHLAARDTSFALVSRAPLSTLQSYRERMGWSLRWVSSLGSTFNEDFGVSDAEVYNYAPVESPMEESPGLSAFIRHDGSIFHTYSCYSRGLDAFNTAYQLLDTTALGRHETTCRGQWRGSGGTTATEGSQDHIGRHPGAFGGRSRTRTGDLYRVKVAL
jgi:predicted dithiol-disulfide oxidoreductase (DUF899 family)